MAAINFNLTVKMQVRTKKKKKDAPPLLLLDDVQHRTGQTKNLYWNTETRSLLKVFFRYFTLCRSRDEKGSAASVISLDLRYVHPSLVPVTGAGADLAATWADGARPTRYP